MLTTSVHLVEDCRPRMRHLVRSREGVPYGVLEIEDDWDVRALPIFIDVAILPQLIAELQALQIELGAATRGG